MKKLLITLLSLLIFTGYSIAEDKKVIWSCKDYPSGEKNILWLVEWGEESYIKVFDERIKAKYNLAGLEKRWDWGYKSNTSSYAITLSPDGIARYYDFTMSEDGTAKSSKIYECKK